MQRYRSITAKDVRGYVNRVSPFMLREDFGAEDRGTFITATGILSYLGGKWCNAEARMLWRNTVHNPIPDRDNGVCRDSLQRGGIAIGIALRHRYEWAVNIGFSNTPTVRISTDPTGMKELFRLRDVSPGRDRRDALMNWVSDHWRKERFDPEVETYVRKHLRGGTKFDWRGFECEIVPAGFDIEQRNRLIDERKKMRTAGTDKRLVSA